MSTELPVAAITTASQVKELQSLIQGQILIEGDALYDTARKVWNGMIDRRPLLIAQCNNSKDVIEAVKFARQKNIGISVKGGGHNIAGNAIIDGGLMIDLSLMKKILIDPVKKTAKAEGGVLWQELDQATQQYGLATTGGTVSNTGIAGLTLGGGLGWLMGQHGFSCDNLISAEIVTANGELLNVDKNNHPDLFWAVRGGGGNFGIVTTFEYQIHNVGPTVLAGMLLYKMEDAKEVFKFYREFAKTMPDELSTYAGFIVTPDGLPVTMLFPAWFGATGEGEKQLAPLRNFGAPIADLISEIPYVNLQSALDAAAPAGIRRYWKSGYFTDLPDELLDIILHNVSTRPSPFTPVLFFHIHGAATRVEPGDTAFAHQAEQWDLDIVSQWIETADDDVNIEWTRKFWKECEPFSKGVYVNHLDRDDGSDRVKSAYGNNYRKLQEVKSKYDPDNFFRLNNNITPA